MQKKILFFLLGLFIISISCNKTNRKKRINISKINVKDIKIKRYEKALFSIDTKNLKSELENLSKDYKVFLNTDFNDSLNLMQIKDFITDAQIIELYNKCIDKYPDLNDIEKELSASFKYYKYYFPKNNIPKVYTYISNFDFENPIILKPKTLVIALDMYLGNDYEMYQALRIPKYKSQWYTKKSIVRDCFKTIIEYNLNTNQKNETLLDFMIEKGKLLYILDAVMPDADNEIKIKYTTEQLQWCNENESEIWSFLIEKEFLYSKEYMKINKFINDGPFTSYFSETSPARIGWYIGWRIVNSYMNNNKNITLEQLIKEFDSQKILMDSKYKPNK